MPRLSRRRLLLILGLVGPGILSAIAGNDAGGIATYATLGAEFGYEPLWVLFVMFFGLAVYQEMVARMGAVTGKGLSDLIRESYGVRWTVFAMLVLLVANSAVTVSEFAGVAAAFELFGISRYFSVPLGALLVWWLVSGGSYERTERLFLGLASLLSAYVIAGFLVAPDWGAALVGTTRITLHLDSGYLLLLVGAVGTTITPWMQFYLQASVVDKGLTRREVYLTRIDAVLGSFATIFVAYFIVLVTAATLHPNGIGITTAADAAAALEPVAGHYAQLLFAIGLAAASLLSASIVPLATAYAVCEAFGWEVGVRRRFDEAPAFYTIYTLVVGFSAITVLVPGLSLLAVMLLAQQVNGILVPVVLVFIAQLSGSRRLMREHANGRLTNALAWLTCAAITLLTIVMIVSTTFAFFRS